MYFKALSNLYWGENLLKKKKVLEKKDARNHANDHAIEQDLRYRKNAIDYAIDQI